MKSIRSFRVLIPLLIFLTGIVIIALQSTVFLGHQADHTRTMIRDSLNAAGTRMAGMARYSMEKNDPQGLAVEVGLTAALPHLLLAVICDESNTIIQSTQKRWIGSALADSPLMHAINIASEVRGSLSGRVYESEKGKQMIGAYAFQLPIKRGELQPQGVGVAIIGMDLRANLLAAQSEARYVTTLSGIVLGVVSLLLWYALNRILTRPIQQLVSTTESIATGDYESAENFGDGNELSVISDSLNGMSRTIRAREDSLLAEIKEREAAEASSSRLANIVEQSVNEVSVFDSVTLRYINVNRSARENLGYSAEELQELTPCDITPGFNQKQCRELLAPFLDGSTDYALFESEHCRKNGSTYPVEIRLQIMRDENPPVFIMITQDISERQRQMADLLLRDRAIAAIDTGVIITDATLEDNPIVYVNHALEEMTGYGADEMLGRNPRFLQGEDRDQEGLENIRVALMDEKPVQVVVRNYCKDGTQFMDEVAISPVRDSRGNLTHFIGVQRDVTVKLDTESRLRQAQKIDAIGQLSGGIAHDFNNILTIITGNLEFMERDLPHDELQKLILEADSAAQMGARLTRRLLTFARQGTLDPTVIDLNDQVISALELLRPTIGEHISLSSNMQSDLWSTRVDPSEIENTVVNLAINSRDAMPNGGRIIFETANVSFVEEDEDIEAAMVVGDYVKLTVSDNGEGMPPEVQARIFEPFFTTKAQGKGTGLGLASIYGFARQSGGYVTVYSEVGHGTTIHVYLPRHKEPSNNIDEIPSPVLKSTPCELCILVVEDNPQLLKLTVRRLRQLGFSSLQAENGPDAIKVFETGADIGLVFSDVVMAGGMSGFDVARWVKLNKPDCKILLTSGFNEQLADELEETIAELSILQKPYNLVELQTAVLGELEK